MLWQRKHVRDRLHASESPSAQVRALCTNCGVEPTVEMMTRFGMIDVDSDGEITFDEFFSWYADRVGLKEITKYDARNARRIMASTLTKSAKDYSVMNAQFISGYMWFGLGVLRVRELLLKMCLVALGGCVSAGALGGCFALVRLPLYHLRISFWVPARVPHCVCLTLCVSLWALKAYRDGNVMNQLLAAETITSILKVLHCVMCAQS